MQAQLPPATEALPFKLPAPDSVWAQAVFEPTYDPLDMVRTAFWVQTKSARVVPFNLFRTQQLFCQRMGLRNVTVKPRQVGLSTIVLALATACAITTPNLNIMIITHREDITASMRETIKKFIDRLRDRAGMDITLGIDNADQLEIKTTNSNFYFGSSSAPGVGRGKTIHILLASELAHWQGSDPGKELGGMLESIPDTGLVFVESTPNGAAGPFFELYSEKDNGFTKHFYPWFIEPSRRIPLPEGEELQLTVDEERLVTMHNLTHEQIAWRRWKWKQLESVGEYFLQEYPEDDLSCFVAGLRSAFNTQRMLEYLRIAEVVPFASRPIPGKLTDPGGELVIWREPETGGRYLMCCDVGGGHAKGDWSYGIVRNARTGEHVASLRGHWDPSSFAAEAMKVALWYNTALLSHETTGLGAEAARYCIEHGYPNYRYEERGVDYDRAQTRPPPNPHEMMPGFNVTNSMRNRMMGRVLDEVVGGEFKSRDRTLIEQMTAARFERKLVGNRMMDVVTLPKHMHDDALMAYGQSCVVIGESVVAATERPAPRRGMS